MNTTAATIALQRGKFYMESQRPEGLPTMPNPALAYTVQAELMQLGYMLDEQAFSCLQKLTNEEVIRYHDEVISYARYTKGDGAYRPLYSGFPQQVMELSDIELFWNAICHYASNGTWEPNAYTEARPTAFEHPSYKMLTVCCEGDFMRIFADILSVNQSITPMDKEALQWFVAKYSDRPDFLDLLPREIPFKENFSFLLSVVPVGCINYTLTDILRMATYLSGGDVSLAAPTEFHLTGSMRRRVMQMLEHYVTRQEWRTGKSFLMSLEDMKHHRRKWLALLTHIHADSKPFRKAFPEAQRIVNLIRWHEKRIPTWNSKVENASSLTEKLSLLSQRPGEFARRLNSLLKRELEDFKCSNGCKDSLLQITKWSLKDFNNSKDYKDSYVLKVFTTIAPFISNKVLFELFNYFEGRRKDCKRTIFIKGTRKPVELPVQPALVSELIDEVQRIILAAIWRKFTAWPAMGDVVIDEKLKNIPLPTNMRTVSPTDTPVVRGTRFPVNAKADSTIRFYVHWNDPRGTEDLDLSATFVGMGKIARVSWNSNFIMRAHKSQGAHMYNTDCIAIHSGDVRHRKGDCAEYIDLVPSHALAEGYRYVIVDVRNFERRSLKSINPAFGYMERDYPEANNQWIPATVVASMRLQSEAVACIAVMIDLETMEYIPMDIDTGNITASDDAEAILTAMRVYMEPPRLSVYDLITWHVQARGGRIVKVDSKDSKDFSGYKGLESPTYFRFSDFDTSYVEVLKLMADNPPQEEPGNNPPFNSPGPPSL